MEVTSAHRLWEDTLSLIRGNVNGQSFETWFKPTKGRALDNHILSVEVPSPFFADWLEEHYLTLIEEALGRVADGRLRVSFAVAKPDGTVPESTARRRAPARTHSIDESQLHGLYTFDTFVVGKGNEFAYAAALAVAEAPATTYNPLFVYGGVGLGKTHLLQAIGNFAKQNSPSARAYYTSAENFMNEMIQSIQNRTTLEFKRKYRSNDLLLLDDVHFLADKVSLQEEIFYTFNALYEAGKQIVLTSDRPPKDIPSLEERLVSRFHWGLVADIQPPDLETRAAILRKKAERDGIAIPNEVTLYIATNVKSNIRELEGCLIRLLAFSSLTAREITVELAQEVLRDIIADSSSPLTVERIQRVVAEHYGVAEEALRGRRRTASIALPRQVAMYLSRKLTPHSLSEIGSRFGGKDHTTVMHACDKIGRCRNDDANFDATVQRIELELSSG
jgi:chromosomal replication initiator protein